MIFLLRIFAIVKILFTNNNINEEKNRRLLIWFWFRGRLWNWFWRRLRWRVRSRIWLSSRSWFGKMFRQHRYNKLTSWIVFHIFIFELYISAFKIQKL
jgi:hypothetical protein